MPKATVQVRLRWQLHVFDCFPRPPGDKMHQRSSSVAPQAAIGSTALDMAMSREDDTLKKYGMDVLTMAVLAILLTAPVGALIIGLAGPRLLQKPKNSASGERVKPTLSAFFLGM